MRHLVKEVGETGRIYVSPLRCQLHYDKLTLPYSRRPDRLAVEIEKLRQVVK